MQLTEQEQQDRRLSEGSIEQARRTFADDGIVLVEAVVDTRALDACREAIHDDLASDGHQWQEFPDVAGIGTSFFDFDGPFADPEIVANPVLLQLLEALLGPDLRCPIYNTNVSKPGADRDQPIHVDIASASVEGSGWSPHVSVGITLCEFTEENGSTELWPGTHRLPTRREDDLRAAAAERPSIRANLPAGSLILRDASVWHRGKVNRTGEHREMLSLLIAVAGGALDGGVYGRPLRIRPDVLDRLPEAARPLWAGNLVVA